MYKRELLAPTTAATQSSVVTVANTNTGLIVWSELGLVRGEYIDIEISPNGEDKWQPLWMNGAQYRLWDRSIAVSLSGPAFFRVNKPLTTNPVGIYSVSWR